MRKFRKELIMFIFFMCMLTLLIYRLLGDKIMRYHRLKEREVIEHNCDEPKDYVKEKWLSRGQREYYEYLYNKTD